MPSSYQDIFNLEAKQRGWGEPELLKFQQHMSDVSTLESGNQPTRAQMEGGPGRGKYQYELAKEGSGANLTARKRLEVLAKKHKIDPKSVLSAKDYSELYKEDPDFTKISEEGQDILFTADKLQGTADVTGYMEGKINSGDLWVSGHWIGHPESETYEEDKAKNYSKYNKLPKQEPDKTVDKVNETFTPSPLQKAWGWLTNGDSNE